MAGGFLECGVPQNNCSVNTAVVKKLAWFGGTPFGQETHEVPAYHWSTISMGAHGRFPKMPCFNTGCLKNLQLPGPSCHDRYRIHFIHKKNMPWSSSLLSQNVLHQSYIMMDRYYNTILNYMGMGQNLLIMWYFWDDHQPWGSLGVQAFDRSPRSTRSTQGFPEFIAATAQRIIPLKYHYLLWLYYIILYYIMSYHIIIIYIYIISIILPILKFPSYSCPNTPIIPFEIHHFWAETSQDRSDKRPTSTISVTRRLYSLRFSDLGRWWSEIVLGCAGDLGVI